jgi:heme-degrading monooxygenase HmoA
MWVRIDEITFAPDRADEVIAHVRNTAIIKHDGPGFRGFRLLVDRANARALDVSYWDSDDGAREGASDPASDPTGAAATTRVRTNVYELAIDAV